MAAALLVGINYYRKFRDLKGPTLDADSVRQVLERHEDGTKNFDCHIMKAEDEYSPILRGQLMDKVTDLFKRDTETVLFYFSGHGSLNETGGYINTSHDTRPDEGVSMANILTLANKSKARNKIIILDCCHSGALGDSHANEATAELKEGMTILTASAKDQYAVEQNGKGLFTDLLVDALRGGAANLVGQVTPSAIYSHIDQALGEWEQRPVFKTHVKKFLSLRQCRRPIELNEVHYLTTLFPQANDMFQLDPSFEPDLNYRETDWPAPNAKNVATFKILQKYNRLNLLVPVGADHMYYAAIENKACRLTALGQHYHHLVRKKRI